MEIDHERASNQGFVDRYRAVGLTGNPFVVTNLDDPDDLETARFVDRGLPPPPGPGALTLVQVIGHSGAGKTTQVKAWRRSMAGPYHYIPRRPYLQRWRRPPIGSIVYGDEIDRMPRPLRHLWFRRLARIGATVVVGTHIDLGPRAARAGLAVVTHHVGPADRDLLASIIAARLGTGAFDEEGPRIAFTEAELAEIHTRSGGVVRDAEELCHQVLADRVLDGGA